jgi:hypothetical protein
MTSVKHVLPPLRFAPISDLHQSQICTNLSFAPISDLHQSQICTNLRFAPISQRFQINSLQSHPVCKYCVNRINLQNIKAKLFLDQLREMWSAKDRFSRKSEFDTWNYEKIFRNKFQENRSQKYGPYRSESFLSVNGFSQKLTVLRRRICKSYYNKFHENLAKAFNNTYIVIRDRRTDGRALYIRSQFSVAFVKLKATIIVVMSVHPSVRPHATTRLPQDGFTRNLIFGYF